MEDYNYVEHGFSDDSPMVKEKYWETPNLDEINPGMIIEIGYSETGRVEKLEVLGSPYLDNSRKNWCAKTKSLETGEIKESNLVELGIVPQEGVSGNFWNRTAIPIRWEQKD